MVSLEKWRWMNQNQRFPRLNSGLDNRLNFQGCPKCAGILVVPWTQISVNIRRELTSIHYYWTYVFPIRRSDGFDGHYLFGLVSSGLTALIIDWSNSTFSKVRSNHSQGFYQGQHSLPRGWAEDPNTTLRIFLVRDSQKVAVMISLLSTKRFKFEPIRKIGAKLEQVVSTSRVF